MENEANRRNIVNKIFIGISFIGFCLYFLGIANMFVWLIAIIAYLLFLNRVEVGIFALLLGSSLFGRMFAYQSLYIGVIVVSLVIGMALLYKEIIAVINNHPREIIFAVVFISFFMAYFLISPMTDYGKDKILKLSIRTLIWVTTFLIFAESNKIEAKSFGVLFFLLTIFYLSQAFQLYHVHAHNILDFSSFRLEATALGRNSTRVGIVSWHTLGYLSLAGCTFWISKRNFWENDKICSFVLIICSFWIIAIAGARQTFFSFAVVLVIRYLLVSKDIGELSNIIKICFALIVFIFAIELIGSSYYDQVLFGGDTGSRLNRDVSTPDRIMEINPMYGVGFGGYPLYANKDYPHNLWLELICELGIVGAILFLSLILVFVFTAPNKNFLRFTTKNDTFLFLLVLIFFLRSQISGDVADSMSFISILLVCGMDISNPDCIDDEISDISTQEE